MSYYNMTQIIIDVAGQPGDDAQSFLVYMAAIALSLITIFFVIYLFQVIAGIISVKR